MAVLFSKTMGSPPRMRGKVYMRCCACRQPRITPAYAGKRTPREHHCTANQDHPRVCGEKKIADIETAKKMGSPPRMRGKVLRCLADERFVGITPAYAGKSCRPEYRHSSNQDHPRVCGEKPRHIVGFAHESGSPPRMRGKAEIESYADECDRITPAYAGKRD